jgi:hypothetical protein
MTPTERRKTPRIADEGLSLKVKGGDFDIITHTLNVSASGIYCKVEKEIPLMSRLQLMLMMPDPAKDGKSSIGVEVDGVVVRQHPVIIDGHVKHYDIAIFFENLSPKHRDMISDYIARKKGQP